MTTGDYIRQRFSCIGEISDAGISDFALDAGLDAAKEATDGDKRTIAALVDGFINDNILHPASVDENGFSVEWSADTVKARVKLMLRKYGITLDGDTAVLAGLGVIRDASGKW